MPINTTKWKQDFFKDIEPIRLMEPLAHILGAQDEGEPFVINYTDAVLVAGHSCPAVSGAYRLTQKALKALYGEAMPIRGQIKVLIKGGPADLAYGPQSHVISLITGAAGVTGFKGLGGRWGRNNRLFFDSKDPQFNTFIFQREDTGKTVKVTYDPQAISGDPRMGELAPMVLGGTAGDEEKELFFTLWQGNVRKILMESDNYPGLIEVEELTDFEFPQLDATY
ncbi:MAG: FmdE family protein [Thermodesulfobacteriota bacterium]|nr:MAG: FmdE family protein [Thermodesulfobacteriota bacterium]